jgi:ABC-type uncharacterized transport system involved in gliding motility auxiliary subunit
MQIAVLAVLGLVSIIIGFLLQFILTEIRLIGWCIIAFGVILLTSSLIIEFRRVRSTLTSRRGKFGTSTTILISVFIGIILLVNAVGANFYHLFDFTGVSKFTITSQTKDVLAKLETPVEAICFLVPNVDNVETDYQQMYLVARNYAPSLLKEYQNYTDKLSIRFVDPDEKPEEARKYNITSEYLYQSVVFESENGSQLVPAWDIYAEAESSFTSAILQVTGTKQKKVYFLTGHGEASPTDTATSGYDSARKALRENLFLVYTLDLLATPSIPDDCAALVIAGPQEPMNESERQIIADYLKKNGNVFFMTNPESPDDIAQLVASWGADVKSGTVIDPSSFAAPNKDSIVIPRDRNYFGMTTLYFPGITAVEIQANPPQGMDVIPLAVSSGDSWMEQNYDPTAVTKYDEGTDLQGPVYLGSIITPAVPQDTSTSPVEGPTIAVIGDSDFANNKNFFNGNNGDLFLNIINSLAAGKEVISIDRKVLQTRRLILTREKDIFLKISSIALLGGIIWWRRR